MMKINSAVEKNRVQKNILKRVIYIRKMFIFAVRFNCKKWGSLYMSFWIHKVLDFNML